MWLSTDEGDLQALDRESGNEVAVKALSLKRLSNWKQLELFEREAGTLASLSHPNIPRYVAHFEQDTQQDRAFFLVQVRRLPLSCLLASVEHVSQCSS